MNNDVYRYQGGTERSRSENDLLPEGDYNFTVKDAGEPYFKNEKWIVQVDLQIENGPTLRYWPWTGTTLTGDKRDGVGDFLAGIARAPQIGQTVDWSRLAGAKGRCRLKIQTPTQGKLAGKELNVVAWVYRPKPLREEPLRPQTPPPQYSPKPGTAVGPRDPRLNEPDDIPF
jgi:hypothetical protein